MTAGSVDSPVVQEDETTEELNEPAVGAVMTTECKGWGLTAPLFGISNRKFQNDTALHRSDTEITGPVQSGLGGGYFSAFKHDAKCEKFALGWEAFGFSEGLNPAEKFQIGGAFGLQLHVYSKFSFGLALGMDLVRREKHTRGGEEIFLHNGLLVFNEWESNKYALLNNLTVLITFTVADLDNKDGEE